MQKPCTKLKVNKPCYWLTKVIYLKFGTMFLHVERPYSCVLISIRISFIPNLIHTSNLIQTYIHTYIHIQIGHARVRPYKMGKVNASLESMPPEKMNNIKLIHRIAFYKFKATVYTSL